MRFVLVFFFLPAPLICIEDMLQSSMCFSPFNTTVSNICQEEPNNLSCSDGNVIMIGEIQYAQTVGSEGNNCSACNKDANVTNWNIKPSYFEYRLHQLCSLQETCVFNETVEAPSNESNYVWHVVISYTCIQNETLKDMCSSWETTFGSNGLHIRLEQPAYEPQTCSCIIDGNHTNVLVVDYRPYLNRYICANSTVFVNDNQTMPCSHMTDHDFSLYNTPINVSSSTINITLVVQTSSPEMFWLYFQDSENTRVWCNKESDWTSQITRQSTSTDAKTSAFASRTTLSTSEVVRKETSISQTSSTISCEEVKDSGFPTSIIVGGLSGFVFLCALIIIVLCLVRKRKLCKEPRPVGNKNEYNTVCFENKKTSAENMNGIMNPAYDRNTGEARLHPESDREAETDSVYSKPFDTIEDENYTEVSQTQTQRRNSSINIKENETQNFEEMYGKVNKNTITTYGEKTLYYNGQDHAYNTLSGLDTYSHIHDLTGQKGAECLDNYSHVKVKKTGTYYENTGKGTAFYNPVEPTYNNEPLQGFNNDDDEEEYDHIGHLKPHVGESCL